MAINHSLYGPTATTTGLAAEPQSSLPADSPSSQQPTGPQRRWHPLLEQWVIVSPASSKRPWSGEVVSAAKASQPTHDPQCYLCAGVTRSNGLTNPDYEGPWAFDNDYASLSADGNPLQTADLANSSPLATAAVAGGRCRVLCWSPIHSATLATIDKNAMRAVVALWQSEYAWLSSQTNIAQVSIFENKGTETGVSNLHPHGQVYGTDFVTDYASRMRSAQHRFAAEHGVPLMPELIKRHEYQAALLIESGQHFVTIVPFAARFAFESWIVPRQQVQSIDQLSVAQTVELASLYQRQAQRYDVLFQRKSPNITLLHNAPCDNSPHNSSCCFHIAMQPPLRDAHTLKYLAGFESGAGNIVNPIQPEQAAAMLRDCNIDGFNINHGTLT